MRRGHEEAKNCLTFAVIARPKAEAIPLSGIETASPTARSDMNQAIFKEAS